MSRQSIAQGGTFDNVSRNNVEANFVELYAADVTEAAARAAADTSLQNAVIAEVAARAATDVRVSALEAKLVVQKFTVDYTNAAFKVAAVTADVALFTVPAKGKLLGVTVKEQVPFAGTSVTTLTGSVGNGATTYNQYSVAYSLMAVVADTTFQDTGALFKSTTMAAAGGAVSAHFICDVNFGSGTATVLTAGSVDIEIAYILLP